MNTGVVLDDVRELLAYLNGSSHSHIRKSANHVAHLLSHLILIFILWLFGFMKLSCVYLELCLLIPLLNKSRVF